MLGYAKKWIVFQSEWKIMSSIITMKGFVAALPQRSKAGHVMLVVEDKEYPVIPRGAGVDLDEHVGATVQVSGVLSQEAEVQTLFVRSYTVLDDDMWLDDD